LVGRYRSLNVRGHDVTLVVSHRRRVALRGTIAMLRAREVRTNKREVQHQQAGD